MTRYARPTSARTRRSVLEIRDLETAYGDSQVLFGMELAVEAGQAVTLMGRNGMGKTTTIRSIMGLTPARSGSITFEGAEIRGLADYKIAQLGLGLVPDRLAAVATRFSRTVRLGTIWRPSGTRPRPSWAIL